MVMINAWAQCGQNPGGGWPESIQNRPAKSMQILHNGSELERKPHKSRYRSCPLRTAHNGATHDMQPAPPVRRQAAGGSPGPPAQEPARRPRLPAPPRPGGGARGWIRARPQSGRGAGHGSGGVARGRGREARAPRSPGRAGHPPGGGMRAGWAEARPRRGAERRRAPSAPGRAPSREATAAPTESAGQSRRVPERRPLPRLFPAPPPAAAAAAHLVASATFLTNREVLGGLV